jgi:hypothetical protein
MSFSSPCANAVAALVSAAAGTLGKPLIALAISIQMMAGGLQFARVPIEHIIRTVYNGTFFCFARLQAMRIGAT